MRADPVADLLTSIRNGLHAHKERVDVPWSRLKESVMKIVIEEGFLKEYTMPRRKDVHCSVFG